MAAPGASMPFIKNLASSDRKIRTHALDSLKGFLSAKYGGEAPSAELSFEDARKVWAGLFYALWMADRAPAQQRMCDELAGLPRATGLNDAATAAWLRGFWATMASQWTTGIDVLRMNKFMLLVRRVLGAQIAWMAGGVGGDGKTQAAEALGLQVLEQWPLNAEAEAALVEAGKAEDKKEGKKAETIPTMRVPVGLTLHVVDIWVDEVERLAMLSDAPVPPAPAAEVETNMALVTKIKGLVERLAKQTTAPAVRKRAQESLEDERLPWNATAAEAEAAETEATEEQKKKQTSKTTAGSSAAAVAAAAAAATAGMELQGDEDLDMADDGSWDGFNE